MTGMAACTRASPGYFAVSTVAMRLVASVSVSYFRVRTNRALVLNHGMAGSIRFSAMAWFTAFSGERYRWDGRLWQSMQSIVRRSMRATSFVKFFVLNTVTLPWASVTRTHGIFWRAASVAMYSTVLPGRLCQWMPPTGPCAG